MVLGGCRRPSTVNTALLCSLDLCHSCMVCVCVCDSGLVMSGSEPSADELETEHDRRRFQACSLSLTLSLSLSLIVSLCHHVYTYCEIIQVHEKSAKITASAKR